jgi:hypothetical protein
VEELGRPLLRCTPKQLVDALTGSSTPMHRQLLGLYLERLQLLEE